MPLYTTLAALSQTPASNAPDGSVDAPSTLDDQLRLLGSFTALLRDGKAGVAEQTLASAATTDIGNVNSPMVQITGTTTITSFGTNYNGPRFLRFAGALTLTHNASTLILPGAANITTAAGDSCVAYPIGNPASGWVVRDYTIAAQPPQSVPAGTVIHVAMNTAPSGYLKANGAAVSRTTYAALFAAIGTTFGSGDGSTTFNLPDLRGEFVRGWDDGRGVDSGRVFGSAQSGSIESHTHPIAGTFGAQAGGDGTVLNAAGSGAGTGANGGAGTETRPRNVALLACIKF